MTLALTDLTAVCFWIAGFAYVTGLVCGVLLGLNHRRPVPGKRQAGYTNVNVKKQEGGR